MSRSEKQKEFFRIAKQMKERKDVRGAKFMNDERGDIKVQEEEILENWREFFEDILNEENEYNQEEIDVVEGPIEEISREVKRSLRGMKSGRVPGTTGVMSDFLKRAYVRGELTKVFRSIFDEGEIPEDWKNSITVPIYKG